MKKRNLYLFLFIFFLSGFSGLIYESIWTHYLKLYLGHAAYAQTLVLIIFMGGMAIGSYFASIYLTRWKNLFLGYALVEGIIGLLALVFHEGFTSFLDFTYTSVLGNLDSSFSISSYKWISAALLILPQSILLGTTFPLMSSAVLRDFPKLPGKNISLLYFTNSLGAGLGVLVSGFYLIKTFGLPGTIRSAGMINILIAIVVFVLIKKYRNPGELSIPADKKEVPLKGKRNYMLFTLLGVAFFTGMASFIYEIAWIRMLNLVLGTSTHAFELMLSAFIFGLAFGGLWIKKRIDRISDPVAFLGYVQIVMGTMAVLTLLLYNSSFDLMQWVLQELPKDDDGYFLFNLASNGIAFMIMFPATFCAGMTLPLITTILFRSHGEKSIGIVYAWNTLGAIVGVVFAVHIGMAWIGLKGLINFGAGIDMAMGLLLLMTLSISTKNVKTKRIVGVVGSLILLLGIFFIQFDVFKMASGVYQGSPLISSERSEMIYYKDGKTATASITEQKRDGGKVSIRTNGKTDASIFIKETLIGTGDESTMVQIAMIPMALHPEAEMVANIGLGAGITTKTVLQNPKIKSVHTIEIEQEMVNASKLLGSQVEAVFSDPRSRIVIDDAKSFFVSNNTKYDIILSEPSNPWVSGVAGLFSKEFYQLIKKHLYDNGVFAQWLQLYDLDIDLLASVLKAVSQNFPDYEVYILNDWDCLIVAKKEGSLPPLDTNLLSVSPMKEALSRVYINNVQDIEIRLLGNKKVLDPFLESIPIQANSDYYPVLDQNAAKTRFISTDANNIYSFTHQYHPVISLLTNKEPRWDSTDITLSYFYKRSKRAIDAMELRNIYTDDGFDNSLFGTETVGKHKRLPQLFDIANRMLPYLTQNEMDSVWEHLGVNEISNFNDQELNWLKLFRAISRKDAEEMVTSGKYLLSNFGNGMPDEPKAYLISAIMLGDIMQGKLDDAQTTWYTEKEKLSVDLQSEMLFKFLLSQCKDGNFNK